MTRRRRPFETFTSGSGTVIAIRWLSGSSPSQSLSGHQMLAPGSSSDVANQGAPRLSRAQITPLLPLGRPRPGCPW